MGLLLLLVLFSFISWKFSSIGYGEFSPYLWKFSSIGSETCSAAFWAFACTQILRVTTALLPSLIISIAMYPVSASDAIVAEIVRLDLSKICAK